MKTPLVPVVVCFLLAAPLASNAAEVFVPASADTTLFELSPFNNLGASPLAVGATADGLFTRSLLRFDLTNIPPNATISSATLHFVVWRAPFTGGEPSVFGVHRFLKPWTEGTGAGLTGSPANDGESTWVAQFHPADLWSQAGGAPGEEYAASASSTVAVNEIGPYSIGSTPELVADVQAWVSGTAANHGWIMISSSEDVPETARRIFSREESSFPPLLQVQFEAPPEPQVSSWAITNGLFHLRFIVPSTYCYEVEFRDSLTPGMWDSLTNFCAPMADVPAVAEDSLSNPQRFYRLRISGRVR